MSRIACLHIPRFQIVVHQKHENFEGKPLALVTGKLTPGGYNRARIFMCCAQASQYGVFPEMRLSEATVACAELVLRELDPQLYLSVQRQLTSILLSCSPKISAQEIGDFLLDASGLIHMGGENTFCHNILKSCSRQGFTNAYIGIADSAFAATVASHQKKKRFLVVTAGQDEKFLAPLPIKHLRLDPHIESSMMDLGVKSMGQLANLSTQSLRERFGTEGERAHLLVHGIDKRKPTIPQSETKFECFVDMGGAVSTLHETTFALKSMLDRLTSELGDQSLWAEELHLSFYNEDERFNERSLKLIRPSNHPQFLLQVIRLSLEADPLEREFTKMKLRVSRFSKEMWEQPPLETNEFKSHTPAKPPTSLLLLLQRFLTSIGNNSIVKAVASDHYTFDTNATWVPVTQTSYSNAIIPIDMGYASQPTNGLIPSDMVLKRHPVQVLVELQDNLPSAINYQRQWYRIKCLTRPEYFSVLWWDKLSAKDYYRVLAEPTGIKQAHEHGESSLVYLMLLTHNKQNGAWYIEGFFD